MAGRSRGHLGFRGEQSEGAAHGPLEIKRNLKKLPRVAGPLDVRKLALYDLAEALADVGAQERAVVEACAAGDIVCRLAALLADATSAQSLEELRGSETHQSRGRLDLVSSGSGGTIRVGQQELKSEWPPLKPVTCHSAGRLIPCTRRAPPVGGVETRLYGLTCLVNLVYLGGGYLLFERDGAGLTMLVEALMEPALAPMSTSGASEDTEVDGAVEERRGREDYDKLLYYAVAGLYNLADSAAFAAGLGPAGREGRASFPTRG